MFTATLSTLLADLIPVTSALIGAGLLLAGQRLVSVILSFVSGPVVDRFEASRLLVPCGLVIVAGLFAIAAGYVYAGAVVLILARALFAIVSPVIAAQQSTDRIGAIAAYATWSDCGLAAGAFIGIMGMEWAGYPATYALLAGADARGDRLVQAAPSSSAASARVTPRFCRNASRSRCATASRAAANERSMRVAR